VLVSDAILFFVLVKNIQDSRIRFRFEDNNGT